MTDPNIKVAPFDIDHDRDGLSLRHSADGRLTARDGARVWTSIDQGRTWKAVETDCDGPDFRTVEVQAARPGRGWRPIHPDRLNLSLIGVQTGRGQRSRTVPFTDTPGPDGAGAKSGIMIEVPVEGWPEGWRPSPENPRVCFGPAVNPKMSWQMILPNTEPGRRAAWAMEGE